TIFINPATLTVTTPTTRKTYDGTALTAAGSYEGLVNGETIGFETTGSQTDAGSSNNSCKITWKGLLNDYTAKESNYTVSDNIGKLTVNAKPFSDTMIEAGAQNAAYDGSEHKYVPVLKDGEKTLVEGTDYTVTYSTEDFTNVGNVIVTITGKGNYSGSLEQRYAVTQAPLTIVTQSGSKVYDEDPLTADGEVQGLVEGETVEFSVTGTQTYVGSSKNNYSLSWTGTAVAANYFIAEERIGELTVTENADEIVVTTTGGEFTYDGAAHGATVSVSTLPKGYYLETAASTASATNVDDGTVTATADQLVIRNKKGDDVTAKLNISYNDGSIKINPAGISVITPNAEKTYDGTELTASGSISGFVNGETATFSTTGTQTEVGTSTNSYSLVWNGTAAESNYSVVPHLGTLEVKENTAEITVTTTGGIFTYDGQAHGATVEVSTLPAGYTLETATSSASVTDANYDAVAATCDNLVIRNAAGVDVTDRLNIKKIDGTIKVNKATLTVVTPNDTKVYDGTALTKAGTISGFVNDETATFETIGTQTDVGSSDNNYNIIWDGTAKESNYTVSATIGILSVTESKDEITVVTSGGIFTYDGQAHGATVEVLGVPAGYYVSTARSDASATDVTSAEGVAATCDELVIKNQKGEDVTDKLNIKLQDSTIFINPATLTVTTPTT
ncbi:MAG: hypothetical protein HUJ78_00695, partial [Mogibacterium sp.]|nr:hypothetical protein [Mogibacterium sp.]